MKHNIKLVVKKYKKNVHKQLIQNKTAKLYLIGGINSKGKKNALQQLLLAKPLALSLFQTCQVQHSLYHSNCAN